MRSEFVSGLLELVPGARGREQCSLPLPEIVRVVDAFCTVGFRWRRGYLCVIREEVPDAIGGFNIVKYFVLVARV